MEPMTLAVGLAIVALLAAVASLVVLARLRETQAPEPEIEPERLGAKALRESPEQIDPAPRRRRARLSPALVARLMAVSRRR